MKKVVIAFDGNHFSEGAFEFVRRLNELQPILLTGVFLSDARSADFWNYAGGLGGPFLPVIENNETEVLKQITARFEKLCCRNGIDYRVHTDINALAIPELEKESTYADLLVIGSEKFYENIGANSPNEYLQGVLNSVGCPLLLVPEKFDFPESIVLAFDGSTQSVYAIKQFACLFPELTGMPTLLVYVNESMEEDFPDKVLIEELVARHFSDLAMFKLSINPKKYFSTWISDKKSSLLVSGAYGRSGLSQLLKKSFVSDVITMHQMPVFIAHQ